MARRKTEEEKKLEEWKKMEKKFLGKIRKDKKRNEGKKVRKEEVKCFKCQEKGHFMSNCKSKEWVKRKNSQKKRKERTILKNPEKDIQEKGNKEMETMLEEMENNDNNDEEMLDY